MPSPDPAGYVLRSGDRAVERLRLLAAVTWPTTRQLLHCAGLRSGLHCLDVGCGIGAVTLRMAEAVQPHGRVTGIDFDERCLETARREAEPLGWDVEFRAGSAATLSDRGLYDLVFARFLLTHLAEPERALDQMVHAARPGGVVVVEDIQFSGNFSYPACSAFDRFVGLYQQVVQVKGGDANIGPRLLPMFLDARLQDVQVETVQPAFRQGPGKQMAAVTMEHIREAVVSADLAGNAEIDRVIDEINAFAADSSTLLSLPRIFQVWGTKPV